MDPVMPKTEAPSMDQIRFSVPAPMLEQGLALADKDGLKPAEFHRTIWMMGLSAYSEQANKRMIAQGLMEKRAKQSDA